MPRVRVLTNLPIYCNLQIKLTRIRNFIRRDHPWPENGIRIGRLAKTSLLGTPDRQVESDRIAGHILQRVFFGDPVAALADYCSQFHFVIIATIELPQRDAFAGTD